MGIKEDLQKLLSKEKHQTIIDKLRSNHIKISPSQKEEICTLLILLVLLGVKKIETAADEKSLGDFLVQYDLLKTFSKLLKQFLTSQDFIQYFDIEISTKKNPLSRKKI